MIVEDNMEAESSIREITGPGNVKKNYHEKKAHKQHSRNNNVD